MGGKQSQEIVVREVESDQSLESRLRGSLESQLKDMKEDVVQVAPVIEKNIIHTITEINDAVVLRYSQLDDYSKISANIQLILGNDSMPQVTEFLVETAKKMIAAMNSTDEMKEAMRWQMRKQLVKVGDKVIGMEAHYRVKLLEEKTKHYVSKDSKNTVVMIGYKILIHSLQGSTEALLSTDELKGLTF